MSTKHFSAPWGKLLWAFTIGAVVILVGVLGSITLAPGMPLIMRVLFGLLMVATLGGSALTAVRGYRLEGDTLYVRRLLWENRVPLKGLTEIRHDRKLLDGALRVGNGGLFAFSGWFWSKPLGWFHLAGNDILGRPVLLEMGELKWVVTPDDPEAFIRAVKSAVA